MTIFERRIVELGSCVKTDDKRLVVETDTQSAAKSHLTEEVLGNDSILVISSTAERPDVARVGEESSLEVRDKSETIFEVGLKTDIRCLVVIAELIVRLTAARAKTSDRPCSDAISATDEVAFFER